MLAPGMNVLPSEDKGSGDRSLNAHCVSRELGRIFLLLAGRGLQGQSKLHDPCDSGSWLTVPARLWPLCQVLLLKAHGEMVGKERCRSAGGEP